MAKTTPPLPPRALAATQSLDEAPVAPKAKPPVLPAKAGATAKGQAGDGNNDKKKVPGDSSEPLQGEATTLQEEQQAALKPDFWRQPWVQNVLPLATSITFHVAIILIGFATYKAVQIAHAVIKEEIIIPESNLSESTPGGIPHPGLGSDPTRDAAQDIDKTVPPDSQSWATRASDNLNQQAEGASGDTDASAIGVGANNAMGGKGAGGLSGTGEGGQLAPFGVPGGGGGMGPKSNFAGLGGNAKRIMYLCDAYGSMLSVFPSLRSELKRSLDGLRPIQSFNIIFFTESGDAEQIFSRDGLVMATPDNKRRAYSFIDGVNAHGTHQAPEMIKLINMAMAERPELVYVLTDGFETIGGTSAQPEQLIDAFAKGNLEHKIRINCIFLQADEDPKLVEVLQKISRDSGGLMKTILKTDF